MSQVIYVGNLSLATTNADLEAAFSRFGPVHRAQISIDVATGLSRGCGVVEMNQGGDQAVAQMNGQQLDGRALTVNDSKPRGAF